MAKEPIKSEAKFEVHNVATQTAEVLTTIIDGKQVTLTVTEALALLLNKVEHLEQLLER